MRKPHALLVLTLALTSLAALTQDAWAVQLVERLKAHAVFGKMQFVARDDLEPLAFAFQRPDPKYGSGFENDMVKEHAPWLQKLALNFRVNYAEPMGLKRRDDRKHPSIVMLWLKADFTNYMATAKEPDSFTDFAHYDEGLGAVVSYEYGAPTLAPTWRRWPELAETVRGELDAYKAKSEVRLPHLITEGLASYLAYHLGADPSALDQHKLEARSVERVVRTMHDYGQRNATLLSLPLSLDATNYEEHRAALIKRAGPAAEKLIKPKDMQDIVQAHAWTFVHYLNEGEDGRYRAPFLAYLKSALQGDRSVGAFQKAFPGIELGALEANYYKWLFDQCAVLLPNLKIDPAALKGIGAPTPAAGGKPKGATLATFDAAILALADTEIEAQFTSILVDIRAGHFDAAVGELEALKKKPKSSDFIEKIEREIQRCKTFMKLRDKYLADTAAGGGKFSFEHDGKKVTAKIKSVADGKVYLEDNKAKLASIDVAELDALELAKSFDKTLADGPDGWARWYPSVLAGDPKAAKALKGSNEAIALKDDAEKFYPGALKLGEGVALLVELGMRGAPSDKASADVCLETIKKLRDGWWDATVIKTRAPGLEALATTALRKAWDPTKLSDVTAAKVELLPDSRVRLTYEFDKKEELADFVPDHGYFASWRNNLGALANKEPTIEINSGSLRLRGATCLRLGWRFSDPILIKYEVGFEGWNSSMSGNSVFAVAAADDGKESFVWCQGFGSLFANYIPTKFVKQDSLKEGKGIDDGARYPLELELSKRKLVSREAGTVIKTIEDVPNTDGGVFIYTHADPFVVFDKLVIEAKPDLAAVEESWIKRKVAEFKF